MNFHRAKCPDCGTGLIAITDVTSAEPGSELNRSYLDCGLLAWFEQQASVEFVVLGSEREASDYEEYLGSGAHSSWDFVCPEHGKLDPNLIQEKLEEPIHRRYQLELDGA